MIGPNVTLATPMHPFLPEERNIRKREDGSFYNLEYAKPITIKDNCWLASNVVVCGGVTIEELTDSTKAVIRHFIVITYHLALYETQAGTLVEFQACLHIETTQPWPCCSLLVSMPSE